MNSKVALLTLYPECRQCSSLTAKEGLLSVGVGVLRATEGMPVRPQQAM